MILSDWPQLLRYLAPLTTSGPLCHNIMHNTTHTYTDVCMLTNSCELHILIPKSDTQPGHICGVLSMHTPGSSGSPQNVCISLVYVYGGEPELAQLSAREICLYGKSVLSATRRRKGTSCRLQPNRLRKYSISERTALRSHSHKRGCQHKNGR